MSSFYWSLLTAVLIILSGASGLKAYLKGQEENKPENRIKVDNSYYLEQFRKSLKKGGSLTPHFPKIFKLELTNDDFKLIENYIKNNFHRKNVDSIKELVELVKKRFQNNYEEVITSSPKAYFSLCPSLVIQYYKEKRNYDVIKVLLNKMLLRYIENPTDINHIVFHTVFNEIQNDLRINKVNVNIEEYLESSLKDEKSRVSFEKAKSIESRYLYDNFDRLWGKEFRNLGGVIYPWH